MSDAFDFDALLSDRIDDFADPRWMGYALVRALVSCDREQRVLELANWREAAAAGVERARVSLREADRFVLALHVRLHAALYPEDA